MQTQNSPALSITTRHLFSVGTLVTFVTSGLRGYIIGFNDDDDDESDDDDDDITCSVRYELDNTIENFVRLSDITVTNVGQTENRSGLNRHVTLPPSAASAGNSNSTSGSNATRRGTQNTHTSAMTTNADADTVDVYNSMKVALTQSITFASKVPPAVYLYNDLQNFPPQHPLIEFLCKYGEGKEKGWLCKITNDNDNNVNAIKPGSELTEKQKNIFNLMISLMSGYDSNCGLAKGHSGKICHAFAVHLNSRLNLYKKYIENNFSNKRVERKDKGVSVFTSEKKRKQTYTAYNTFKKQRNKEFRETNDRIPNEILRNEWDNLTETQKSAYTELANQDCIRARSLWDELKDFLVKTKGKVSYSTMATYLGNIVSTTTVRAILKKQQGFYLRKDRILPALDVAAKGRRVTWAHTFWWFWKLAKCCPVQNVQFVSVHMDEKWFYAIRTRTNCKVLTSIGLEPSDYYAHHKSYLGKIMYVVVTAFVPYDNDFTKGGRVIPVACIRAGKMVEAAKDSYKRVYKDDGSYHYPPIPENLVRRRGEEYFKNLDITGSSEGTAQKPKCSLLKMYKDEIIPALEEKVVDTLSENGTRKICIVKQEDSAGPHQDAIYKSEMMEEFEKREWLLFNQPSQSPVTNVHDACIFPMMSKEVSKEQAVNFSSTMLRTEQLHATVQKVWNNNNHRHAMAKAFAAHPQIVCAIIEHEGDNNYLTEKGGLSFGIRRTYRCNENGDGVQLIDLAPQNENETAAGRIVEDRNRRGLKYEPPKMDTLRKAHPTQQMKDMLMSYIDEDLMTDTDVREAWTELLFDYDS